MHKLHYQEEPATRPDVVLKELQFMHVDVFTQTPFAGNPLAVVLGAEVLSVLEMHSIAEEFGMPETTFVLPASKPGAEFRVRILTPVKEVPFAGHPLVGTAHTIVTEGLSKLGKEGGTLTLETGVGVLPVEVSPEAAGAPKIVMTQAKPKFLSTLDKKQFSLVCDALRASEEGIKNTGMKPQVVSTGLAQLFVPITGLKAIQILKPDFEKVKKVERELGLTGVGVFTMETADREAAAHLRFFAPSIGINEDAAAGSAAGGLGAYLAKSRLLSKQRLLDFSIEQGMELGRPSKLLVSVEVKDGNPYLVKVGGYSTTILKGFLRVK